MKTSTKKIILFSLAAMIFHGGLISQNYWTVRQGQPLSHLPGSMPSPAAGNKILSNGIQDTLRYSFNKHYYRNPSPTNITFNYFLSPSNQGLGRPPVGSFFSNPGTMTVTGLEGQCEVVSASPSASVPVRFYLCHVNGNGLPQLPAIDSVVAYITPGSSENIGGNFTTPRVVSGNFAVLYKNISTNTSDTIGLSLNNALTASATAANSDAKYGEGYGIGRIPSGVFIKLTNIFGQGTDYEFIVAPRVTLNTNAIADPPSSDPCIAQNYTYTRIATPYLTHRQYNLNEFYRRWYPFGNVDADASIKPDSVFSWNFGDGQGFQDYYNTTISHSYAVAGNYTVAFVANYQKMSALANTQPSSIPHTYTDNFSFPLEAKNCSVGLNKIAGANAINVYPNPSSNGIITVSGLSVSDMIFIYDLTGQQIAKEIPVNENKTIDLSAQPSGSYLVRIINADTGQQAIKFIQKL